MNAMKNTKHCEDIECTRQKTGSCFSMKSQGCPLQKDSSETNGKKSLVM